MDPSPVSSGTQLPSPLPLAAPDAARALALSHALAQAWQQFRTDRAAARRWAQQAELYARALGHNAGLVDSLLVRGRIALAEEGFDTALGLMASALHLAEAEGDPGLLWRALDGMAMLWASVDQPRIALGCLERALDETQAGIADADLARLMSMLGGVLTQLGEVEAGGQRLQEAVRLSRSQGDPHRLCESLHNLGCQLGIAGRPREALACLEEAASLISPTHIMRPHIVAEQAESWLQLGDATQALALVDSALEFDTGHQRGRLALERTRAMVLQALGQPAEAWAALEPVLAAESAAHTPDRGKSLGLAVALHQALGQAEAAQQWQQRAEEARALRSTQVERYRLKATLGAADLLQLRLDNARLRSAQAGRSAPMAGSLLQRAGWQPGSRLDGAALGLSLVYQPFARMADAAPQGAEVLLRWHHPRLGPLLPLEFIALLEADGGILPVGDWVLRTACAQLGQWRDEGLALQLAVNLSPAQLRPGLCDELQALLAASGLPITALELELTEGAALVGEGEPQRELQRLSDRGIPLAIDDFGTAFANYDRLSRVRFDKLKLDRSLCRRAIADERAQRLLHGLVNTAHELQMTVTAEGVETDSDWRLLAALGCDQAQGYRLAAPLAGPDFADWWRARCPAG